MAIVFDSTVNGASSNSYASVAELDQYNENFGRTALSSDASKVALIRGTSWLDSHYRSKWITRSKTTTTQKLHWGQSGAYDSSGTAIDDDVIPEQVKNALFEYVFLASGQDTLFPVTKTNLKKQKLSTLEQEFFGRNSSDALPDKFNAIDEILYGLITGKSGGISISSRVRSS